MRERQADRSSLVSMGAAGLVVTPAGTNGGQTINANAGTVNLAPGATSLVLTNSKILTSDKCIVQATQATQDGSMIGVTVVQNPAGGSCTFFPNSAAPAGAVRINWAVISQ